MDDAGLVRGDEPAEQSDARCAATRDTGSLPSRRSDRREIVALDVRHRDVLGAVDLAEVVNADDVLVGDLTGQQQLALESPLDLRSGAADPRSPRTDHLDRHGDAQLLVPRLVDDAHAADAEQTDDV